MDKIEKLLRRISKKDIALLQELIFDLVSGNIVSGIIKLKGTDLYRIRKKGFRIVFHYEENDIIIDDVRMRNEKTYKKLKS